MILECLFICLLIGMVVYFIFDRLAIMLNLIIIAGILILIGFVVGIGIHLAKLIFM